MNLAVMTGGNLQSAVVSDSRVGRYAVGLPTVESCGNSMPVYGSASFEGTSGVRYCVNEKLVQKHGIKLVKETQEEDRHSTAVQIRQYSRPYR